MWVLNDMFDLWEVTYLVGIIYYVHHFLLTLLVYIWQRLQNAMINIDMLDIYVKIMIIINIISPCISKAECAKVG